MKLSCLQENLNRGLGIVSRAVASRTTLPITTNVLLKTDQSRLKLVATNLEMAITYWLGCKIESEGEITVPAKLISEFVASLPSEQVDIELPAGSGTLGLKCARFSAKISGADAADFPPIPSVDDGITVSVDVEILKQAIDQVAFAAATEESRPVLTGVYAEFEGSTMTLAAADGFRLAVYKLALAQSVGEKIEIIIPARALTELSRLMAEQQDPITIKVNPDKGQVLFVLKNVELVSQLVQGTFPKYAQLIPESHKTSTVVDVAAFLRATRTASIFARDGSGIVRLIAVDDKLTVKASSEELGEDTGEIDADVNGEEAKIAFNSKYLIEVLSVIKEPKVALETTNPSSPGVIRPLESDAYVHVVMPMFVQW